MMMKVVWEAADVRPGTRVRKPDCNEVWMIGYDAAVHGEATPAFAIVSLADGMICEKGQTAEQVAAFLNHAGNQPVSLVGEQGT
jgi:hypothetical protein